MSLKKCIRETRDSDIDKTGADRETRERRSELLSGDPGTKNFVLESR